MSNCNIFKEDFKKMIGQQKEKMKTYMSEFIEYAIIPNQKMEYICLSWILKSF